MAGTHDTILARYAKSALEPLGFHRKGRSRTWIADHGWWANVVEFQPSSWSKGSYLNVAAHWMWSPSDYLSFDYGGRIEGFIEYVSDEQFSDAAKQLTASAAREAASLENQFASIPATASILLDDLNANDRGGWQAYHAAIASGLADRGDEAIAMFGRASNAFATFNPAMMQLARQLAECIDNRGHFRQHVRGMIDRHRVDLKLSPLGGNLLLSSP